MPGCGRVRNHGAKPWASKSGVSAGASGRPVLPKPLPNNWILGQVSGVAVDKRGHVWIVQRPRSLSDRELGAQQNPPWSKCCRAAPPVIVFDQVGVGTGVFTGS